MDADVWRWPSPGGTSGANRLRDSNFSPPRTPRSGIWIPISLHKYDACNNSLHICLGILCELRQEFPPPMSPQIAASYYKKATQREQSNEEAKHKRSPGGQLRGEAVNRARY